MNPPKRSSLPSSSSPLAGLFLAGLFTVSACAGGSKSAAESPESAGHHHSTAVRQPKAEIEPMVDVALNPRGGAEIGQVYESYLSPGLAEEATARLLAFDEAEAELREAIRAVSALPPPPPASGGQEASGGKQQLDTTAQTLRDAIARCSGHASAATIEEAEDTLEALCPLELELEPG